MSRAYAPAVRSRQTIGRHRLRLQGFDYTYPGLYFVTFCTAGRECILSTVVDGVVHLTSYGRLVVDAWREIRRSRPHVHLVAGVIMPDHVHVIVALDPAHIVPKSLPAIIGAVKTYSATRINRARSTPGRPVWQRGFYDRRILSAEALAAIRGYIAKNPARWQRAAAQRG
jgi:putative transposase